MSSRNALFREFVHASAILTALFSAVFYGAEYLAGLRSKHLALYFEWERAIPFHGTAYAVYYSVFALPFFVPFVLDDARIRAWRNRMAAAIVIAGVVFVLFPAQLGYPELAGGEWRAVTEVTAFVAGRHNLVPSLHVALTLVIVASLWERISLSARAWMSAWGLALASSTLFTHQHHVVDVVTGTLLAVLVCWKIPAE